MIDNVVIVGGGTAGWMTAAYLRATYEDRVAVTVVESAQVGRIGVGEATFSTIRHFFDYLGLSEQDWMPACNASYKLAVRFQDWRAPGHHFYHPFERLRVVEGFPLTEWWLQLGPTERFDKDCFLIASLCDNNRSPRYLDGRIFEQDFDEQEHQPAYRTTLYDQGTQFPYAYHFDAVLLADFLRDYSVKRGVRHVEDDVLDVALDERGWISHLRTAEHGEVSGDLFVDATGFRGLLINQAMGEPFESFLNSLPNDRAVALRVPLDMDGEGLAPYTRATAKDAGWIWTIPLFNRIGTGYVYASHYASPEEAERTLREFVGPAAADAEANHIRMRIGRCRDSWVNNCVAIGLSSGFVEPLESTGIFIIQHGIEQLAKHFPDAQWRSELRDSYNRVVARAIEGIREFLVFHYKAARRNDNDYWRDAKTRSVPNALGERLEQWLARLPDNDTVFPYYHALEAYSYVCIALGMGGRVPAALPTLTGLASGPAQAEFALVREQAQRLVAQLPRQYDYLALQQPGA